MSEKEFLKEFLEYAEACDFNLDDNLIQTWLDYYHTDYYEVEFIKKTDELIYEKFTKGIPKYDKQDRDICLDSNYETPFDK